MSIQASLFKTCLLAIFASVGFATASPDEPNKAKAKELQVLCIGNSQIYYNNLPKMLEALADSAPAEAPRIRTDRFVPGGASLERLWEAGDGKSRGAIAARRVRPP